MKASLRTKVIKCVSKLSYLIVYYMGGFCHKIGVEEGFKCRRRPLYQLSTAVQMALKENIYSFLKKANTRKRKSLCRLLSFFVN